MPNRVEKSKYSVYRDENLKFIAKQIPKKLFENPHTVHFYNKISKTCA